MPELPEIEHLRRTLEPWLVGARVIKVNLRRRDVVRVAGSRRAKRGVKNVDLLEGCVIRAIERRGKSLAIVAGTSGQPSAVSPQRGKGSRRTLTPALSLGRASQAERSLSAEGEGEQRVLVLHMGMTGTMRVDPEQESDRDKHVHCEWVMERVEKAETQTLFHLLFRDPRRFGGLWPFDSLDDLHERAWRHLGPDALDIDATTLREWLLRTKMPMKAALLNQKLIAGVGNIYADEALFAARIHPLTQPRRLSDQDWKNLAAAIRRVLNAAIKAGGSSIRDYRDAAGNDGGFAIRHRVYGLGGLACLRCRGVLETRIVGQRTTVFCSHCQPRYPQRRRAQS